jgi:hypothetical protein
VVTKAKKISSDSGQTVHLHVGGGAANGGDEVDREQFEQADADEGGLLSQAVEQFRTTEGVKAEVIRIAPIDRTGFCRSYPIGVVSAERIAADFGAGKYRIKFKGPNGFFLKGGTSMVEIAEGVVPERGTQTGVQDLLAVLKTEREREAAERSKKTVDWLEWAKVLGPIAAPVLLQLFSGKSQSLSDMIRAVKDLKDLQAPAADLNTQFAQVINVLQGAKELVGGDGGQTGSTWVDLLRDFLGSPAMGALAQGMLGQAQGGPPLPGLPSTATPPRLPAIAASPGPVAPSATVTASVTPSPHQPNIPARPVGDPVLQQLSWLRGTLAQLLPQAAKGSNPRLYAEVILDNIPEFLGEAVLREQLAAPDWFEKLKGIDNRVEQHQEWFTKFRDYAVRVLIKRARRAEEITDHGTNGSAADAAVPPGPAGHLPEKNQPMAEGDQFE